MNAIIAVLAALVALGVVLAVRFRKKPDPPAFDSADRHNQLFKEGSDLVYPYMALAGVKAKKPDGRKAREEINRGISTLERVLVLNPQNWAACWVIGKGYQALGDHERAYEAFKASWAVHKENADVAREYMLECLNLGKGAEGVALAEQALELTPDDPGLIANHALALLIDGQVDSAEHQAQRALRLDDTDKVTQELQRVIANVKSGKRRRPTKYDEAAG